MYYPIIDKTFEFKTSGQTYKVGKGFDIGVKGANWGVGWSPLGVVDWLTPQRVLAMVQEMDNVHKLNELPMKYASGSGKTQSLHLRHKGKEQFGPNYYKQHLPVIQDFLKFVEGDEYTIGGKSYLSTSKNVKLMRYLTHLSSAHHDNVQDNAESKIHFRSILRLTLHN